MAQFDVHRNLGRSRVRYPYLIVVQSGLLRRWNRRVVVPLAFANPFPVAPDSQLNPIVMIDNSQFFVASQEIANVPLESLGDIVASLRDQSEIVINAVDWMLCQGFG